MSCRLRWLWAMSLLVLPTIAVSQEAKAPIPAVVARFSTLDDLMDQVEYLAKVIGKEEEAKQMIGFFRAARGTKGIDGVDTKRPIAFYASQPEGLSIPFYLMIPVADEKAFIEDGLGKRLRIELQKESDTVRSLEFPFPPVKIYLKFANGYAYFTALELGFLDDKKLPDPKTLGSDRTSLIDVSLRLDAIPEQLKLFALGQTETVLAGVKKQEIPGETKAMSELRVQAIDLFASALKAFLMETKEITFKFKIDPKGDEVGWEWNLTPVEGTKLAKDLESLRAPMATFGGLGTKDSALRYSAYYALPASLRKPVSAVIDESFENLLSMVPFDYQELAKMALKSIEPTLKGGEWDAGVAFFGPDKEGHISALFGHRLYKGAALDETFRTLVKNLPEGLNNFVELDVAKGGKTAIHKFDLSSVPSDKFQKYFSRDSHLWLAFAEDRALIYIGTDGKERLKEALETPPAPSKLFEMSISMGRFAPYYSTEKGEAMRAVAETIFGKDLKNDRFTLSLEGGKSLNLKVRIPGKVLTFIGAVREAE